jgi:hypothetical protein
LRGSWPLPDARAIDAAIDCNAGWNCANYASQRALSGSICLLVTWEHGKRGRTPSIFIWRRLDWLIELLLLWLALVKVKFAAAIDTTKVRAMSCMKSVPFTFLLIT